MVEAVNATPLPEARNDLKLVFSAFFTWLVVGLLGWPLLPPEPVARWVAIGLFVAFAALVGVYAYVPGALPVGVNLALQALCLFGVAWLTRQAFPFGILYFILAAETALAYQGRALAAWLLLFLAFTYLALWRATGDPGPGTALNALLQAAGYAFFAAFATVLRQVATARAETQRLLVELQAAHEQLKQYMRQAEELAIERERNRMARALHSSLGYRLGLVETYLQALRPWVPREAEQDFALALEQVQESLRELKRVAAAAEEEVRDLAVTLHNLAREASALLGIPVETEIDPHVTDLPRPVRLVLYSAAREGLDNIRQHAHASWAMLSLRGGNQQVTLVLEDDGVGPPRDDSWQERGAGLRGIAQRVARWGGTLRLERRRPQGARLVITLPYQPADPREDPARRSR